MQWASVITTTVVVSIASAVTATANITTDMWSFLISLYWACFLSSFDCFGFYFNSTSLPYSLEAIYITISVLSVVALKNLIYVLRGCLDHCLFLFLPPKEKFRSFPFQSSTSYILLLSRVLVHCCFNLQSEWSRSVVSDSLRPHGL